MLLILFLSLFHSHSKLFSEKVCKPNNKKMKGLIGLQKKIRLHLDIIVKLWSDPDKSHRFTSLSHDSLTLISFKKLKYGRCSISAAKIMLK